MALAYVAATSVTRTTYTGSQTISFASGTCDLLVLWTSNYSGTGDIFTGVTFNGSAMTKVTGASGTQGAIYASCWYIYGQSGTHDIVVSFSGSNQDLNTAVVSYSGALQSSSVIAASNFTTNTSTSITCTITTAATANCWVVGQCGTYGETATFSAPTTQRSGTDGNYKIGDSNGTVTASSTYDITATMLNGNNFMAGVEIAPAVAAGPANLKSYNTNVKANIKSIDTNLIANVKSLDTNA